MPARRPRRPRSLPALVPSSVEDPATMRALDGAAAAIGRLEGAGVARALLVVDLALGANVVNHRLGRRPRHAHVTPTTADATFAYALTAADTRQATITVVGVAQPGAGLELS